MSYLGITEPLTSLGTDVPTLVTLLVCLIPTTIAALLAATGIAGMDRALQANIIAKSGEALETAGDYRHRYTRQDGYDYRRQSTRY
jgi:K+-transporting ATPase ATPase B chain